MDRPNLSASIIREIGETFMAGLSQVGPALLESDLDGIEQRLQDLGRRVMGEVVEGVVRTLAAGPLGETPQCPSCQRPMRLVDVSRPRDLQGLVGDYTFRRPYYGCVACHHGMAPLDERLGLGPGALSPGLARVACRLGIEDSFGEAADALAETLRVDVAREAMRRITEGIGAVAEAQEQAAIAQAQAGHDPLAHEEVQSLPTGAALLIEVDGAQVHLDDDWHEAKVGLAASLGPQTTTDPDTGRETLTMGQPSYCAGFESAETFWWRIYVEACRQGLGSAGLALIVVLGDGAEWIWHYAPRFLAIGNAEIVEIVDIFHAWEHLGTVATAVFGHGTRTALAWLDPLKNDLLTQGVGPILAALAQLTPTDPAARDEVRKALGYFMTHAERMDYPRFVARHLPIGSGAVESACKTLIEEREKGAGMRWTKADAQAVASLRALWRPGRWVAFWHSHPLRRRPKVFPRLARPGDQNSLKQAA
jgi:ribosomal protein L34E